MSIYVVTDDNKCRMIRIHAPVGIAYDLACAARTRETADSQYAALGVASNREHAYGVVSLCAVSIV